MENQQTEKSDMPRPFSHRGRGVLKSLLEMAVMVLMIAFVQTLGAVLLPGHSEDFSHLLENDVSLWISQQEILGEKMALQYPVVMILSIIAVRIFLYVRTRRKSLYMKCSLRGFDPIFLMESFLWYICLQVVLDPLHMWLGHTPSSVGLGTWSLVVTVLAAPVLEEILMRGIVLERFRELCGNFWAIILSALFFSLLHPNPDQAVNALMAGLLFGTVYIRTGSIAPCILLHMANNALAYILIALGLDSFSLGESMGMGLPYIILYSVCSAFVVGFALEMGGGIYRIFRRLREVGE